MKSIYVIGCRVRNICVDWFKDLVCSFTLQTDYKLVWDLVWQHIKNKMKETKANLWWFQSGCLRKWWYYCLKLTSEEGEVILRILFCVVLTLVIFSGWWDIKMEYSKGILKCKSWMWRISQKRDICMQEVLRILRMDFLNGMEGEERRFCSPHLKWQTECRGKIASHSSLSYFPLLVRRSQSLLIVLHFPDVESKKVTHIHI